MRTREIPPLKPTDVEFDSHRSNHYETSLNRKYLPTKIPIDFCFSRFLFRSICFTWNCQIINRYCFSFGRIFFYTPHYRTGQQRQRLKLPPRHPTIIGSVVVKSMISRIKIVLFFSFLSSINTNRVLNNFRFLFRLDLVEDSILSPADYSFFSLFNKNRTYWKKKKIAFLVLFLFDFLF